ncbi:12753_t:CDS:2, partial [Racocetra persica]
MAKPASHYNNLRIALLGAGLVAIGEGCQNGADRSYQYSQQKFAEAEALRQQGQADKNQDNQEFNDGLARERKAELSESEVESDLED